MTPDTARFDAPEKAILQIAAAVGLVLLALANVWIHTRPAAAAELECGDHETITRHLERKYSETPVAAGLINDGTLMQIFARADGKTWTLVVSRAEGVTCPLASGAPWQTLPNRSHGVVRGP